MERSQNPYAPPKADLGGHRPGVEAGPATISVAVKLLWASVVVTTIELPFDPQFPAVMQLLRNLSGPRAVFFAIVALGTVACVYLIPGLVAHKIGEGRRWTRWVLPVIALVWTVPALALSLSRSEFTRYPVAGGLGVLLAALQWTAVVLLFLPRSRAWFAR